MALLDESRTFTRLQRWSKATDAGLVRGVTDGHDGAFEEIFARYHLPLVRFCRGLLLDDDVAQDAAQNALTSALRALSGGRSLPESLGPWLYRIAQREAADLARRRRRDDAHQAGDAGAQLLLDVPAPRDERVRERLRELVGDLARLPLRQRSALLLRELSGFGYPEIAVALDTTPDAARQSVFEARQALAESGSGRGQSCSSVRELMDGADRRRLRGRRVRAHLDDCLPCQAFAATITDRRRDLALLFPLAPAVLAAGGGAFAALSGGGAAAGGGAVAASGWTLGLGGLGASGAAKCAAVCATAAIVGVGSLAAKRVDPPRRSAPVTVLAQAPQVAESAAGRSVAAVARPASTTPAAAPAKGSPASRPSVTRVDPVRHDTTSTSRPSPAVALLPPGTSPKRQRPEPAGPEPVTGAPPSTYTTPAAAAVAPAPPSAGTSRQGQLALELQRLTTAAIDQAMVAAVTTAGSQTQSYTTIAEQITAAGQQAQQQVTAASLTSVQAQLELLRQLMAPQR